MLSNVKVGKQVGEDVYRVAVKILNRFWPDGHPERSAAGTFVLSELALLSLDIMSAVHDGETRDMVERIFVGAFPEAAPKKDLG